MIEKIVDIAKRIEEEIIQNRRTLHQMPELGLDLPKTTAFVREQLTQMGYDVADCGPGVWWLWPVRAKRHFFCARIWTRCPARNWPMCRIVRRRRTRICAGMICIRPSFGRGPDSERD